MGSHKYSIHRYFSQSCWIIGAFVEHFYEGSLNEDQLYDLILWGSWIRTNFMDTVVIKTLEGLHCTKLILLFKDNEMIVNKMESLKSCNRCKNETNQVNFCVMMINEFKKFPIENDMEQSASISK